MPLGLSELAQFIGQWSQILVNRWGILFLLLMYQNVPGEVSFYGKLFVNTSDKVRALAILSTSLDKVRGIAI